MKLAYAAAGALLLTVLVWLSFRVVNTDQDRFDRALTTLDHFDAAESSLQRDLLTARSGTLQDYDPLVRDVNELYRSLDRLRALLGADARFVPLIDKLDASIREQETLAEQVKSNNALLHNSLAYFEQFTSALSAPGNGGALILAVGELAGAMLHLTLDTSTEAARDVNDRLVELAKQPATRDDFESVQALMAHGHLLHDILPATDNLLKTLFAVPIAPERDAIRTLIVGSQIKARQGVERSRLLLLVTSALSLGLLLPLGFRLRARALLLRRLAKFEHLIANISTRFINAQSYEIDAHVERALSELAEHVGADRAYFVLPGEPNQARTWSRDRAPYPPGWPQHALTLAARIVPQSGDVIYIPRTETAANVRDREALFGAGVRTWTCVRRADARGVAGVLGFDALRWRPIAPGELGLLRMAFDAIYNALGRKVLEHERSHLEDRLEQARRMETVGALASGIAHNFNNIVGAILGHTEMAEGEPMANGRLARSLAGIRLAGERARDLVDQILALGRVRREVRLSSVDIADLLAETTSLLRASLPARVALVTRDAMPDIAVSGDPTQLQQVLVNLCNNAAQAMDGEGTIEVEVAVHEIVQPRVLSHGILPPGWYASIAVNDTGRGMDEATTARIFEPFFTTREAGHGLGLATVREIVREHGGAMNVRSVPGKGSCFEVWLPGSIDRASAIGGRQVAMSRPGSGEAVLLIDRERDQLLKQEEILAALAYEPIGFTCADDLLTVCRSEPDRFDAFVIADLGLHSSALELARMVREIIPGLPILLGTASADAVLADALLSAGVTEVVRLPFVSGEIASALRRCIGARRVVAG